MRDGQQLFRQTQDEFSREETVQVLKKLPRGKYILDVGDGDSVRISRARWVQKADFTEG